MPVGGLLSLSVASRLCHFEHEKVYIQLVMVTGDNFSKRSTRSLTCFYTMSFHKHGNIILKNSVLKRFLLQTSVKRSSRCILTEKCPMVKGYCKLAYAFLQRGSWRRVPNPISQPKFCPNPSSSTDAILAADEIITWRRRIVQLVESSTQLTNVHTSNMRWPTQDSLLKRLTVGENRVYFCFSLTFYKHVYWLVLWRLNTPAGRL